MKITIEVYSLPIPDDNTIIYDDEQNLCLLNDKSVKTDVKRDMQTILDVLAGAPREMSMPVMDGGGCRIKIEKNGETRVYRYSNSYPKGFNKVWETIGGLPGFNKPSKELKKFLKNF